MEENFLLKTDSYKITHHLQYPQGDHHSDPVFLFFMSIIRN